MRIAVVAAFNRFRLFHWLLAGFFLGAYLSGDDAETLHIWLGYGLVALLVWRLLIVPLRLRGFHSCCRRRASGASRACRASASG
ncbi:hypothetical protein SSTU70S_02696 [Stutzerimonas stutzeri]